MVDKTDIVETHKKDEIVWKVELVHHLPLQKHQRNSTVEKIFDK